MNFIYRKIWRAFSSRIKWQIKMCRKLCQLIWGIWWFHWSKYFEAKKAGKSAIWLGWAAHIMSIGSWTFHLPYKHCEKNSLNCWGKQTIGNKSLLFKYIYCEQPYAAACLTKCNKKSEKMTLSRNAIWVMTYEVRNNFSPSVPGFFMVVPRSTQYKDSMNYRCNPIPRSQGYFLSL